MIKKIFICAVVLLYSSVFSLKAQEYKVISDTVECETCESFSQPQPTDDRYRVVTNRFWSNWFVLGNVGVHAFYGDYSSVGEFSETISPDFNVGVGKWFTPGIGAKLQFSMGDSKSFSKEQTHYTYGDLLYSDNGTPYWKSKIKWWDLNINAMFNLSRLFCGYEGKISDELMNQFILSLGIGGVHHYDIKAQRNEWSGHAELQYSRFFDKEKKFSLDLKAKALLYQTNFDNIVLKDGDKNTNWWDTNVGFSVGFTYYIKKRHWDRCLPGRAPVYNINQTIVMPDNKCPEYGTMEFYVFFPNNYSGRDDAPTVPGATVNAIDYLASGLYTQTKFENDGEVEKQMEANKSFAKLRTKDIPTTAGNLALGCGYEMSDATISLSMNADSMAAFKEKNGYYYAPIYSGNNVWHYRVDHATVNQRLIKEENFMEKKSFSLNAHKGLDIVKSNMKPSSDAEVVSFADVYGAIEGNEGNVALASDEVTVKKISDIIENGNIIYVVAEGYATSQDNFIGENAENVGLERNKTLAFNRAFTVINWLMSNKNLKKVPSNAFSVNALVNPIKLVEDEMVHGLTPKLSRSVKVRIHYAINK